MDKITTSIRCIVPNLRHKWPNELKNYSDKAIALCYDDFSYSDDFGNNDEKFPQWFDQLSEYEE